MFKLLRNYIREQKNNLLQMFGLGFLVMIMIIAFLSLNFLIIIYLNNMLTILLIMNLTNIHFFHQWNMLILMENIMKKIKMVLI